LGLALVAACAGGAAGDKGPPVGSVASAEGSASAADSGSSSSDSAVGSTGDTKGGAEGSSSDTGADGSSSGDGSTTAGAESSSGSSGGGEPECPQLATCPTATVIGEVSGDTGSPLLSREGTEPSWVTFQVTEDNDGVTGEAVSFTATLTSPPGYDFDLFVSRGPLGGATGCGGTMQMSTSAGPEDVVHMSWGEGALANGADDRAWVAAEIRPKDGVCDPTASWSLVVEGDN
jgi:hypothetical protein